jgi:cellulose synthase/poly-beta-1,6-N-acetylglucosamine synthase-like glycosyltransferase
MPESVIHLIHAISSAAFEFFLILAIAVSLILVLISLTVIFLRDRRGERALDPEEAPEVTVQIPTKNEIVALRCARLCLESDYPAERLQILIGDDSDQGWISEEIDDFAAAHPGVKVVRRKDRSGFKPGNLNAMLERSRGAVIVILDSDFTPGEDFIRRIVAPFVHDPEVASVQARWDFINPGDNLATVLGATMGYTFHRVFLPFMNIFGSSFICGSAEAVRKSVLEELGGWRPGILTEDIEFSLRMTRRGKKMLYLPDLSCPGEVPRTAGDLYRQQMRWAHGVISAYLLHFPGIWFNRTIRLRRKTLSMFSGLGYVFPVLVSGLLVTSCLAVLTAPPQPVDPGQVVGETVRNVLLTSGLLILSTVAIWRGGRIRLFPRMVLSAFTIGLVLIFFVLKGIVTALRHRPMEWYLIRKSGDCSPAGETGR